MANVRERPEDYLPWLEPGPGHDQDAEGVRRWCAHQARDGAWGDFVAVQALCDHTGRACVVWRKAAPEQLPLALFPRVGTAGDVGGPLVLVLDESHRGCEHFDALA